MAITGASSGIGRALALAYSDAGVVLALAGRDPARLDTVAQACRARGATVLTQVADVRDPAAMVEWVARTEDVCAIDLLFANAGIGAGLDESCATFDAAREMIAVNVLGTINTIEPAIARMRLRRTGHVVVLGSIASQRGIPGAQGYSASKAAIKALAEGLRPQLAAEGIGISLVMPGFVRTPMNEGRGFPTPLRIEPARAARIIQKGVAQRRFRIVFPLALLWGSRLLSLAPFAADAIAMRAARKPR